MVPINNVMAAAFDAPVATVRLENTLRISFIPRAAGDAIDRLFREFSCLLFYAFTVNSKGLATWGKLR